MGRAFEIKPLLAAALLGAGIFYLIKMSPVTGALVGAGVQVGVRVLGVS